MSVLAERPVADAAAIPFDRARRAMIDSQLRTSGVTDPQVIAAMGRVAREDFVPAAARASAYVDRAIALGEGRFLAAPLFHGRMLAEAALRGDDTVLVVEGGSGYLAELVRPLVAALDSVAAGATAKKRKGGYSLMLVDGAIEALPDALAAQLAEGGRIVTGLVTRGVTRLAVGRKVGGAVSLLSLAEMGIPLLREFAAPKRWSF